MRKITLLLIWLPFIVFGQNQDSIQVANQVDSLIEVAIKSMHRGKFDKTHNAIDKAKELARENFGEVSEKYTDCLNIKSAAFFYQGKDQQAESLTWEVINIREKVYGKNHESYATALHNLAEQYTARGLYEEAEPLALEAKDIYERTLGETDDFYAGSLALLGRLYRKLGRLEEAAVLMSEAINIKAENHPDYVLYLSELAKLYTEIGYYKKAEEIFSNIRKTLNIKVEENRPIPPIILANMATLYQEMAQYETAESLFRETLKLIEQIYGKENLDYASSLNNLALIYKQTGRYNLAEPLYNEALKIAAKVLGKENPRYAVTLMNLALLHVQTGNYSLAEPLMLEAKDIREKKLGNLHSVYAHSLVDLANLYLETSRYSSAEAFLLEAKDKLSNSLGEFHPLYRGCLKSLGKLYLKQNKIFDAEPYLIQSNDLSKLYIAKGAEYLSNAELRKHQAKFMDQNDLLVSYSFQSDLISKETFNNALFHKGFLLNASSRINNIFQFDSIATQQFNLLKSYRRRLAKEYSKPVANLQNIDSLEAKANELEKELVRTVAGFGDAIRQVNWQEVKTELQEGETAVEFIHYQYYTPDPTDSTLYAALVLRPEDESPHFIPLFEEKQLQELLDEDIIDKEIDYDRLYGNGEFRNKLYQLIWEPIGSLLSETKTIYASPSGLLHRINLGALVMDTPQTLSDRYQLITLNSTRQLVIGHESVVSGQQPLVNSRQPAGLTATIYGGIHYEMDSTAIEQAVKRETIVASTNHQLPFSYLERSVPERGQDWNDLKGTDLEADEIAAIVRNKQGIAQVFKGYQATEESFKMIGQETPSPRILHLATHGYFYPDPSQQTGAGTGLDWIDSTPAFKISDHPMIRSGLIMAGGNHAWETGKPLRSDMEDGILTAYEVSQVNLSNTELVVLSACETGLGDIEGNEGVYGLQRAFKIAGAKNLIMSLWNVPDEQTQEMIVLFYEYWLNEGIELREAFRSAQQEMRKKYPSHYYWAAFVLIE